VSTEIGTVIAVHRGECEVVHGDALVSLRLGGRNAHLGQQLAVGDEVEFDPERAALLDVLPRRTQLARLRAGRRGELQVVAANVDRVAIVAAVAEPPFRSGLVDRFMLAAHVGGLEPLLVVNKLDLLGGSALPDEIDAYREILPLFPVSARSGAGIAELRRALGGARTVLAGHSGVGKSSLINALEPELQLATGELARRGGGRHTTARSTWIRLGPDSIAIDTPGVREIASGPVELELVDRVYPDVARFAEHCRFRDCAHASEPGCAVRAAVESGELRAARVAGLARLLAEP
jgi:ribosome biogenesis GTPase